MSGGGIQWFGTHHDWRRVLEQLGDTMWFWDMRTDTTEFTASWLESMGYVAEEIASGAVWFELVHPDDRPRVEAETAACVDGAIERFECEFRIRRKSGQYRWFLSSARIVERAPDGSPAIFVGLYRDTTAQRQAVDDLVQAETRWEHALRGSELGVWDWDLVTNEVYFSTEWKRMLGYGPDELDTTIETWRTVALPEDLAVSDREIARHLAGETSEYRAECRIRMRDGRIKWILDRGRIGVPVRAATA